MPGIVEADEFELYAAADEALSSRTFRVPVKACPDNTLTPLINASVPNASIFCRIDITFLARIGGSDAYESVRTAEATILIQRTAGVAPTVEDGALTGEMIATGSGGDTFTFAYSVSALTGAAGAVNTFTIDVTLNSVGGQACSCFAEVRIINETADGVTLTPA